VNALFAAAVSLADVHEAGTCIEQSTDLSRIPAADRGVNGMALGPGQDAAPPVPRLFQEPRDLGMTPFPGHDDQAAVVQSVPFRIGARLQQEPHGLDVSFSHGEMDGRRVPVLRATESRVSFEQPA
jgi:hypothetical protein